MHEIYYGKYRSKYFGEQQHGTTNKNKQNGVGSHGGTCPSSNRKETNRIFEGKILTSV